MAVNKNFVVKNGLEVNENLIVANATDSFVGVGTSTPNNTLHVFGGIGATDARVTGISSFIQSIYVGTSGTTFAVVDTESGGGGTNPAVGIGTDLPAYMLDIRSAVSTGQTALYVQGDARITGDLIADDIVLDQADFTNINVTGFTTTRELVVGYGASIAGITTIGALTRASAGSGGTSFTFNAAPGLSTNLTVIGDSYFEGRLKIKEDLDVDTNLFIVGILTSQSIHVGSAFTVAGISTFMSDVNVGGKVQTGLEIAGVTTTASSGGITTTGGDLYVGGNIFINDGVTVESDLNILGIATVGVLSARDAVVSGGSTVNGNVTIGGTTAGIGSIYLPDDSRLSFGTGTGDLQLYHDGSNSYIRDLGTGNLYINGSSVQLNNSTQTENMLTAFENGAVSLYYDNTKRFETSPTGAVVTGILTASGIGSFGSSVNVVGAQFVGGNLTVGGDLNVTGDISYDEVTGRNLNITGIATIANLGVTSTTTTTDLSVGAAATVGGRLTAQDVLVGNASTITGRLTAQDVLVSGGATITSDLTVSGDLNVTGDITYDEVSGRNLNITGIATIHTLGVTSTTTTTDLAVGAAATVSGGLTAQDVLVGNASTITGVLKVSATTESTTKDTGAVIIEGGVGIEKNLNLGTTIKMDSTAGVITATKFSGVGEVIGIGSEGTPIGTGVSFIDFRTTNGTGVSCQPAVNGIATVTFTPGASLGMVLALGG